MSSLLLLGTLKRNYMQQSALTFSTGVISHFTCHKSQGQQWECGEPWESVFLWEQSRWGGISLYLYSVHVTCVDWVGWSNVSQEMEAVASVGAWRGVLVGVWAGQGGAGGRRRWVIEQHILTLSASIFDERSVTLASVSNAKGYPRASFFDAWGF